MAIAKKGALFVVLLAGGVFVPLDAFGQGADSPVEGNRESGEAAEQPPTEAEPATPPVETVEESEATAAPAESSGDPDAGEAEAAPAQVVEPPRAEQPAPAASAEGEAEAAPAEGEEEESEEEEERGVLRFGSVEIVPDLKLYADFQIDLGSEDYDNAFHLRRGYLGLRARITSWLGARITYDISQVDDVGRSGSTPVEGDEATVEASDLEGSMVARIKYAYIDLGIPRLSMRLRFGVIHTPYIDWVEHIEGARFLRKVMIEHATHYPSADFGIAAVGNIGQRLSYHIGFYNGEGYHGLESSSFKDIAARLTFRPSTRGGFAGLALTGYVQVEIIGADDEDAETHRRYGGALTYRLAREITSVDTSHAHGDILAAWFQFFIGQEGTSDALDNSFGFSLGTRIELPHRMFMILRLDRFDENLDTADDVEWTIVGAYGVRIYDGVVAALNYQGTIESGDENRHLLGLHVELHL